jgi:Domain of Unknown Function (DUF1080)/Trehalose utilisation/Prolyl oligopeptidase family
MTLLFKLVCLLTVAVLPQQEPLGEFWGTGEEESKYYKLVDIPLPEELAIEAGSFEVMPDRQGLAIATRRGDIYLAEGAFDLHPEPTYKKFASGLDEVFGMGYRNGSLYVTQQTEVTRITDIDEDGRADRFDTLSDVWGFRNYHEFSFGSKPDHEGNIWVALCLSESYNSKVPFRGWCLKITPDGKTVPICSGIRSPCGIGPNEHGVMFYAESQGPWNGSCSLKVLEPGGFMGHPISYNWYELAPEMGPAPVKPNTPSRLEIERKRVKELVPYAVVFPYIRMGRSISGFMVDQTGGKFGPFENQIFIGDFSLGVVMRATTEKVNGVWQGACYPFREGFDTGLLAVQFTPNGSLIAGGTNRGWPVRGPKAYSVQRLDWTGIVPFEIREIRATPAGFEIAFTKPVNREIAARPDVYQLKTFTHIYHEGYGSPEVDQTAPRVTDARISDDGMKVDIRVDGLMQGHVHDFFLPDMRSAAGDELLHSSAYYTLNEIPVPVSDDADSVDASGANDDLHDAGAVGSTKGIIDFELPDDALQLVSQSGSILIPESGVPCQWTFDDGVLTASPKWDSVVTPAAYGDFRMHLEFNLNDAGDVPRETSGNSGVYIQQRYELQILNSHGVAEADYRNDDCGCIYGLKKPDKLVCKPPGQWQSFDIAFRAARFDGDRKTENARITVYHNGELIHDDHVLRGKTGAGKPEENSRRPVMLQGHHNQVQFRNVWIQELNLGAQETTDDIPEITVSQKKLPLPGEVFQLNGSDAFVILPKGHRDANISIPWVWYAPTLPSYPATEELWMFERFLKSGIAVAGIDVGESYGSPNGRNKYDQFYKYLTTSRKFGDKPALLARSRGGLMLYSWAIENPGSVSGIAGIYPVTDIASYPGLERACAAYELSAEQLKADLSRYNPVDRVAPLAEAQVPIFHIHGDQDDVVPLKENSLLLAERYRMFGGEIDLEVVAGQGHNMWDGWFQSERLVEFVCQCLGQAVYTHPVPENELWLTYPGGDGPGKGKHIVLIAADQEYRSEQSMPMLARILSQRHGFDCTVLFSVNERGEVDPTLPAPFDDKTRRHNIPGLEYLADADCVIWLSRFMHLPDDQMQHWHDYFDSGKPIIALRTANHGFLGGKPYARAGNNVTLQQMLGGAFMEHHGGWQSESTRGVVVPENAAHPILTGVEDIWGPTDVYRCHDDKFPVPADCQVLVKGQPLMGLAPDSPPNTEKEPLPIAWTKTWQGNKELPSRIFHFTMGSAEDFANDDVRRLTINAVYWGLEMENSIRADSSGDVVGEYHPLKSGFNYGELGVQPRAPQYYK